MPLEQESSIQLWCGLCCQKQGRSQVGGRAIFTAPPFSGFSAGKPSGSPGCVCFLTSASCPLLHPPWQEKPWEHPESMFIDFQHCFTLPWVFPCQERIRHERKQETIQYRPVSLVQLMRMETGMNFQEQKNQHCLYFSDASSSVPGLHNVKPKNSVLLYHCSLTYRWIFWNPRTLRVMGNKRPGAAYNEKVKLHKAFRCIDDKNQFTQLWCIKWLIHYTKKGALHYY